jgi:hypothetical protein
MILTASGTVTERDTRPDRKDSEKYLNDTSLA